MKEVEIRLSLAENVKSFVNIVSRFDYEMDLQSGRHVVDAKSILGIFSLALGSDGAIHWGGVTIHGVLTGVEELGSVRAVLAGWLILCAGEAVLAKFAERYFRNELTAGTPFTLAGAGELRRLGILSLVLPAGCAAAACLVEGAAAGFSGGAQEIAGDLWQDGNAGIALGVMFLALSLLCRHGAEQAGGSRGETPAL